MRTLLFRTPLIICLAATAIACGSETTVDTTQGGGTASNGKFDEFADDDANGSTDPMTTDGADEDATDAGATEGGTDGTATTGAPGGETDAGATAGGTDAGATEGGSTEGGTEGGTDAGATEGETDAGATEGGTDGTVEVDPWAQAKDVTIHRAEFPEDLAAPDSYQYPQVGGSGFSMGGTEFWQKWTGGENPTYSYSKGSEFGKRCMYASARRFEALMTDPLPGLVELKENSNWGGSFFNWNDDYALSDWGDGSKARLWAWRTSLVKFISQTNKDGSCYLPTLEMVELLIEKCSSTAASSNGEIQGCSTGW